MRQANAVAHAPPALAVPGWWGKLPGMGDFAGRRLDGGFVAAWDAWLQAGLGALRQGRADWVARYLESPVWLFALGAGLAGPEAWAGVLMPSVDAVGRYFPLTLASAWPQAPAWPPALAGWWQRAAALALQALEQDMDAAAFEAALLHGFVPGEAEAGPVAGLAGLAAPAAGASLWLPDPWRGAAAPPAMRCAGLPRTACFAQLFCPQPCGQSGERP